MHDRLKAVATSPSPHPHPLPKGEVVSFSLREKCVFSAKGASSLKAWGIAPGLGTESSQSAEGASQGTEMNRAFSAGFGIAQIPGALSQAKMNTAPLALRSYEKARMRVAQSVAAHTTL
jgi:hypothetical protein